MQPRMRGKGEEELFGGLFAICEEEAAASSVISGGDDGGGESATIKAGGGGELHIAGPAKVIT